MAPKNPRPPDQAMINWHGVLGVVLVIAAVTIALVRQWDVPWLYFLAAIVGYVAAVLSLTFDFAGYTRSGDRFDFLRVLYGSHLSFLFLIFGLVIPFDGFWAGLGVFIASIAAGMVIPFLLVNRKN
ncbi:hypothetical protein [Nocardia sp. NPDC048505]|uniref:hypothetical protein n=1 Tax=unclassified Nocardia TaxID=2637762 RepID=UPI0033D30A6A